MSFYTKVVGVTFEGRQELLKCLEVGDRLTIVHEPQNPADVNARAVYYRRAKIGYLSRRRAAELDCSICHQAVVTALTGATEDKPHQGVNIQVSQIDSSPSLSVP